MTSDPLVRFVLTGRFAHFAQAASQLTILSYPLPPRTVLLGLAGAVLGLAKDTAPAILEPAHIAVGGPIPSSHWHRALLRKTSPEYLPLNPDEWLEHHKARNAKEEQTRVLQEWLVAPRYTVWMRLPAPYQEEFAQRLIQRHWHFTPYLGISEMLADLQEATLLPLHPLPFGHHNVQSLISQDQGTVSEAALLQSDYALRIQTLPRTVTTDRCFTHARYIVEASGRPITVETDAAYQAGDDVVMFL